MKLYPFIVFAERMRGFDTLEAAKEFAGVNIPSVICERQFDAMGRSTLIEVLRHDYLYDEVRQEWRYLMR